MIFRITLVSSIFLIVGTGIERYLAVCKPHHYHRVINRIKYLNCDVDYHIRSRTNLTEPWPTSCLVLGQPFY